MTPYLIKSLPLAYKALCLWSLLIASISSYEFSPLFTLSPVGHTDCLTASSIHQLLTSRSLQPSAQDAVPSIFSKAVSFLLLKISALMLNYQKSLLNILESSLPFCTVFPTIVPCWFPYHWSQLKPLFFFFLIYRMFLFPT